MCLVLYREAPCALTRPVLFQEDSLFMPVMLRVFRNIALVAHIDSGKTTLTRAIIRELGVNENVSSPTFNILKRY